MKVRILLAALMLLAAVSHASAQASTTAGGKVTSPDERLSVVLFAKDGKMKYSVTYDEQPVVLESEMGLVANIGDFSNGMSWIKTDYDKVTKDYTMAQAKASRIHYEANRMDVDFENASKQRITVTLLVSNNDVAFRYSLYRGKNDNPKCAVIEREVTSFRFPDGSTTFLCPQIGPMQGWERTKPSYEEDYKADRPMTERSQFGLGYTFPCLFRLGDSGWALVSETGVSSAYCGSRLSDYDPARGYTIAYPEQGEFNGIGSATPGLSLPGSTPWRTITIGKTLKPIVETTVMYDVVDPLYEATQPFKPGRYTWSWLVWQDNSINYDDQVQFIDLASAMGFEYCLVDNWWDKNIGRERMAELSRYAQSKGVRLMLWYNSNGYWNDAPQTPRDCMSTSYAREREMRWLKSIGAAGIKVDFFGSDKQPMMQLYEDILTDANDFGLQVIFHGCTLPRGWERMYPNYVASEAVLASENLHFGQGACDAEARNACIHPFIRHTVGSMDFGGSTLNKHYNKDNQHGTTRRTSDVFALATAVLFQSSVQHFALAPNNLEDAPAWAVEFMKQVPTTWDEVRFLDGYPGRYCIVARRSGSKWYVAGINAEAQPVKTKVDLSMLRSGSPVTVYSDDTRLTGSSKTTLLKAQMLSVVIPQNGGVVVVGDSN